MLDAALGRLRPGASILAAVRGGAGRIAGGVVDLYTPSLGEKGLVTIERRGGIRRTVRLRRTPDERGHAFIAHQFGDAWRGIQ